MKKEIMKWRLSKLPTVEELLAIVKDKVITQEEAKEVLFTLETKEEREKDSLEAEIKFLKDLVAKLSERSQIVETIKYVEKPYYGWDWYKPYQVWCSDAIDTNIYTVTSGTGVTQLNASFSDIKSL